jgi:hypothetical protein
MQICHRTNCCCRAPLYLRTECGGGVQWGWSDKSPDPPVAVIADWPAVLSLESLPPRSNYSVWTVARPHEAKLFWTLHCKHVCIRVFLLRMAVSGTAAPAAGQCAVQQFMYIASSESSRGRALIPGGHRNVAWDKRSRNPGRPLRATCCAMGI